MDKGERIYAMSIAEAEDVIFENLMNPWKKEVVGLTYVAVAMAGSILNSWLIHKTVPKIVCPIYRSQVILEDA